MKNNSKLHLDGLGGGGLGMINRILIINDNIVKTR